MTFRVVFRRAASAELERAATWYESARSGLGDEFLFEVEQAIERVAGSPMRYPTVFGAIRRTVTRRCAGRSGRRSDRRRPRGRAGQEARPAAKRYALVTKRKPKSRILGAVHETASDLHRLGFIDKRKMRAYDLLCLAPVPEYDAQRIRELRESLHLSQSVLAAVLNTSVSTVRKWEIGDKRPSGPSSKLLDLIERKGLEAVL